MNKKDDIQLEIEEVVEEEKATAKEEVDSIKEQTKKTLQKIKEMLAKNSTGHDYKVIPVNNDNMMIKKTVFYRKQNTSFLYIRSFHIVRMRTYIPAIL